MGLEAVGQILTAAAVYDSRKPSTTYVAAWSQAAMRGRWTLDEALDAVHAHYSECTEWIMPGHVTQRIRANRSHPAPIERPELPAGDLPSRAQIAAHIADVERHLGHAVTDRDILRRRCPHCGADPGRRCQNPVTGRALKSTATHESRAAPPAVEPLNERTGT